MEEHIPIFILEVVNNLDEERGREYFTCLWQVQVTVVINSELDKILNQDHYLFVSLEDDLEKDKLIEYLNALVSSMSSYFENYLELRENVVKILSNKLGQVEANKLIEKAESQAAFYYGLVFGEPNPKFITMWRAYVIELDGLSLVDYIKKNL